MWDLIVSVPDHCLSFYFLLAEKLMRLYWPKLRSMTRILSYECCYCS